MADESSVLVVANVTATSRQLIDALRERAERGNYRFSLVVPARSDGFASASERLEEALARMRGLGLNVDGGEVGASDPVEAAAKVWDPGRFDEIVVSTLPAGTSKWLEADVPRRLAEETGAPVTHVIATGSGRETFNPAGGE